MKNKPKSIRITAFRGQYGLTSAVIQTRLPSISFGSLRAAKLYAEEPNNWRDKIIKPIVMAAKIEIKNPIIFNIEDCFADFEPLAKKLGSDFMWSMAEKFESRIEDTCNWADNFSQYEDICSLKAAKPDALKSLYIDAYLLLDDPSFVAQAKNKGYDGAIHVGNGETYDELEYRIFAKEQILGLKDIKMGA